MPGAVSADQKRKDSNHKEQRLLKRVRVIYSDPDATDSSSDDEQGTRQHKQYTCHGVKRRVKEVLMFDSCSHAKRSRAGGAMRLKSSKYVGVRQGRSGKWTAEIRDPWSRARHWLGTYKTEEEARSAYERKRLDLMQQRSKDVRSVGCVARSPSSVLDVSNTSSQGSDMNAKQERFDVEGDLKMVFDELKEEDFLMCNLGDLADQPNSSCLLDLDMEDFSWLDEILRTDKSLV